MSDFLQIGLMRCQSGFWNNALIDIQAGQFSVGVLGQINVNIQNNGGQRMRVEEVQATVCAAITARGFMPQSIMPSLVVSPLIQNPIGLEIPAGGSQFVGLPWTPVAADLHHFDSVPGAMWEFGQLGDRVLHVCVFVSCSGSNTKTHQPDGQHYDFNQLDGHFCEDIHHGQRNTGIHILLGQRRLSVPFYAGLPGGERPIRAKVSVAEVTQDHGAFRALLRELKQAAPEGVEPHASNAPARLAGIARFKDVTRLEDIPGSGSARYDASESLDVILAPGGIYPLLLRLEIDENESPGSVHIFDVLQENPDQTVGGFRFATLG
jgi:hypothetical protein